MRSWDTLTVAEQTLLRAAMSGGSLAGRIQAYGTALRWAGAAEAPPPRSWTEDEQRALVPAFAALTLDLAERGLVTVRRLRGSFPAEDDPTVVGAELRDLLGRPSTWLWNPRPPDRHRLTATEAVGEDWRRDRYAVPDAAARPAPPAWEELDQDQRDVMICAREASGMLTGPFGIWADLPADLDESDRAGWVDAQFAPLLPLVRDGWIEVRYSPAPDRDEFTVIPFEGLRGAFADPALRRDDADDWGIGLTCVYTHAYLALR
ncbi:hypothetical protein [Kitasatospora herbaricolor]|uniref:Uncharacterized protein n=1 Tax=Kitasatospora herbaricolor TaxID=68217 RepID=A0ABZ1W6B1_9ACTN|nr:hypothetical protein [Kitasatospora herbaricolor]